MKLFTKTVNFEKIFFEYSLLKFEKLVRILKSYLLLFNQQCLVYSCKSFHSTKVLSQRLKEYMFNLPTITQILPGIVVHLLTSMVHPNIIKCYCYAYVGFSCFDCVELVGRFQTSQTGGQPYSHTSLYKVSNYSLPNHVNKIARVVLYSRRLGNLFDFGQLFKAFGNN